MELPTKWDTLKGNFFNTFYKNSSSSFLFVYALPGNGVISPGVLSLLKLHLTSLIAILQ